jgi:hypothetical protein
VTSIKPTSPIPANEQVVTVEDLVFGVNPDRCPVTNRCFERGSGAHDYETQSRLFIAEAKQAAAKAALEREVLRQAEAAAAAEQKPALRLVIR